MKKIAVKWLIGVAAFCIIYPFSYCFVIPCLEKTFGANIAYIIYEPVEQLRNGSELFWLFTERGYEFFGGNIPSYKRYYLPFARREIAYYINREKCSDSFYCNEKRINKWIGYYDNGNIKLIQHHNSNGKLNGLTISYYENGTISSEEHFKDGELDGKFTAYYKNGNLQFVRNYSNGKLNGLSVYYYENGSIKAELQYNEGNTEKKVVYDVILSQNPVDSKTSPAQNDKP